MHGPTQPTQSKIYRISSCFGDPTCKLPITFIKILRTCKNMIFISSIRPTGTMAAAWAWRGLPRLSCHLRHAGGLRRVHSEAMLVRDFVARSLYQVFAAPGHAKPHARFLQLPRPGILHSPSIRPPIGTQEARGWRIVRHAKPLTGAGILCSASDSKSWSFSLTKSISLLSLAPPERNQRSLPHQWHSASRRTRDTSRRGPSSAASGAKQARASTVWISATCSGSGSTRSPSSSTLNPQKHSQPSTRPPQSSGTL